MCVRSRERGGGIDDIPCSKPEEDVALSFYLTLPKKLSFDMFSFLEISILQFDPFL